MNKFTFNIKNEQFSFHFNQFCFVNQKKKKSQICAMKQLIISVFIQLLKQNFNVALH